MASTRRQVGREVRRFDEVASTNDIALSLAVDSANDGVAVLARGQTAGRGQYGRVWSAAPGSSVLMSLIQFPPRVAQAPAVLTGWAATSVCDAIADLVGCDARIKWPNDVYVGAKKVCGILIEQRTTTDPMRPLASVIGIGLNVTQSAEAFANADLPLAGSLASVSGKTLASDAVAETLLDRLDARYGPLAEGSVASLEAAWRERLGLTGQMALVETTDGDLRGEVLEVGFDGLIVRTDEGPRALRPENVRRVTPVARDDG